MKIILCGYNWIGCNILNQLLNDDNEIYVFTHESPYYVPNLIDECIEKKIKFSTDKISIGTLPFKPNLIISAYYRYIIPEDVLQACNYRAFNIHPSLLPEYKGCSSITWAMVNDEEFVGYTFHYIDSGIDTGNIILQRKIKIESYDIQSTLYLRVMIEASKSFNEALKLVISGYQGIKQGVGGKYYQRGCPLEGELDLTWSDKKKRKFIRAMTNPPLPPAKFRGKEIFTLEDLHKLL
jgi:methionyl-tRNA formyltransferase